MARKRIQSKEYLSKRCEEMAHSAIFWRRGIFDSKTRAQKDACEAMSNMYLKRFIWYIKRV